MAESDGPVVGYLTSLDASTTIFTEGSAGIRAGTEGLGVITASMKDLGWTVGGKTPWPETVGPKVWGERGGEVLPGSSNASKLEVLMLIGSPAEPAPIEGMPDVA